MLTGNFNTSPIFCSARHPFAVTVIALLCVRINLYYGSLGVGEVRGNILAIRAFPVRTFQFDIIISCSIKFIPSLSKNHATITLHHGL